jgi:hypothetical protein
MEDEMTKEFELLFQKGCEYMQCVQHMHLRGAGDVIKECVPIVKEISKLGGGFENVLAHFETIAKQEIDVEKDLFLNNIRKMFNHLALNPITTDQIDT